MVAGLPGYRTLLLGLPAEGFEPPTYGLQNRCTTTVLSRHFEDTAGGPLTHYSTAAGGGAIKLCGPVDPLRPGTALRAAESVRWRASGSESRVRHRPRPA